MISPDQPLSFDPARDWQMVLELYRYKTLLRLIIIPRVHVKIAKYGRVQERASSAANEKLKSVKCT